MHTYWVRLNAVFFYGLNVLLGLAVMTWISCASSFVYDTIHGTCLRTGLQQDLGLGSHPRPEVQKVEMSKLISLRSHGGVDRALLDFDLRADFRPAFHWNLKQLFVFVLAEYESQTNPLNQVILWDQIVEREEDALLLLRDSIEYALVDQANGLRNTSVDLHLVWDHMPITGRLFMDRGYGSTFRLPSVYH